MFTSVGRAGRAPTLTVIDERGRKGRERVRQGCGGEGRKSVKKAGYLSSLGEGESPSGGGRAGRVRRGEGRPGFIDKKGGREGGRRGDYVWHRERADNYLY